MMTNKFGDWKKAKENIQKISGKVKKAIYQANIKNGILLRTEMKKGLVAGSIGGKKFKALKKSTIERKKSSKPLIDSRLLFKSINHKISKENVFVGVLKTAKYTKKGTGTKIANIASIMEYGAIVPKKNGKGIFKIPARPFLKPTLEANQKKISNNYHNEIGKVL